MNDILSEELNSAFVAPEKEFCGDTLAPYTEGSRLLLSQIREDSDSPMFFVWAFLFVHIQIKKNRKEAIKLCWDKDKFREAIFEWISTKTDNDREIGTELVGKILSEAEVGRVETVGGSSLGKA